MKRTTLDDFARKKLDAIDRRGLRRTLATTDRESPAFVVTGGERLISFACNDYLGLANDPMTVAASVAATERLGVGAGASRHISGNHSLYRDLETKLAALKGTEDAVVFGSGYLANIGSIPVFAGPSDLVLLDELVHSCILTGAQLSRGRVETFAHNDTADLERKLAELGPDHRHCLVITDGVFSMEGDLARLPEIADLAAESGAWLMTDDAHGLGVVGGGRGSTFAHGRPVEVPLQMGTLSKAVGAYGGYLCGSAPVIDLVRNRARSLVYSTGLPPGTVAAAAAGLDVIARDAARVARPLTHARAFTAALGLPPAESAIVPLTLGSVDAAMRASSSLRDAGFLVPAIRPPTVPSGTARLRFAFSAVHADEDVARVAETVRALGLAP